MNNEKIYLLIICGLIVVCGYLSWQLFESKSNYQVISAQKGEVENDRNQLKDELNQMLKQYDDLKTDNNTLSDEMSAQKEQIKGLLAQLESSKGNAVLVAKYKKEVITLRTVMRSYVITIDSLNQLNQQLFVENEEVKTQLGSAQNKNNQLEGRTKEMAGVIAKAAQLKALSVDATAIRLRNGGSQVETDRAEKTEIVKVCFKIAENNTAASGEKTIYVLLKDSKGQVVGADGNGLIDTEAGASTYSAKRSLTYTNSQSDLCVFTNVKNTLEVGIYNIELYESGVKIGSSTLRLK